MNPGSKEAVANGCTCPILDNSHGSKELGDTRGFYYTVGCPIHDPRCAVCPNPATDEYKGKKLCKPHLFVEELVNE